jgi:hypothetical protein
MTRCESIGSEHHEKNINKKLIFDSLLKQVKPASRL